MPTEAERSHFEENPSQSLVEFIKKFVQESPVNRLKEIDNTPIFEEPVVGFASGQDPLFAEYKKLIGEHHLTPQEVMEKAGKGVSGKLSIVCWALPVAVETKRSNRSEKTYPTRRWGHTRFYGEKFNDALRNAVAARLEELGYPSAAPVTSPFYWMSISKGGSNWSERHTLYAAGLGTFSLSVLSWSPKVALVSG